MACAWAGSWSKVITLSLSDIAGRLIVMTKASRINIIFFIVVKI